MEYVNTNHHPVRVEDNGGKLRRIVSGQVVEADGAFADRLAGTNGVDQATDAQSQAWADKLDARKTSSDATPSQSVQEAVSEARTAIGIATVAAPNAIVIGDDQAPLGPPTGTVTTKQAAALGGPRERAAFAENEALPGGKVGDGETAQDVGFQANPDGKAVHNSQVEAAERVDATASSLASLYSGSDSTDGDDVLATAEGDDEPDGDEPEGDEPVDTAPTGSEAAAREEAAAEQPSEPAPADEAKPASKRTAAKKK